MDFIPSGIKFNSFLSAEDEKVQSPFIHVYIYCSVVIKLINIPISPKIFILKTPGSGCKCIKICEIYVFSS